MTFFVIYFVVCRTKRTVGDGHKGADLSLSYHTKDSAQDLSLIFTRLDDHYRTRGSAIE